MGGPGVPVNALLKKRVTDLSDEDEASTRCKVCKARDCETGGCVAAV
jgi:hypothetical protein